MKSKNLRRQGYPDVAARLREAIVKGAFRGGQPLRQDELAEMYGTSAIPIREALRQMEGEGLVRFLPNRGVVVAELTADEVDDLCNIRVLLETEALRLAIPNLDKQALERAQQILDASDMDENYVDTWSDRNWEFHSTLYAASKREQMLALIRRVHHQIEPYLRAHVVLLNYREHGQKEHRALLRACRRKDVDGAVRLLREHISVVAHLLKPHLVQHESVRPLRENTGKRAR